MDANYIIYKMKGSITYDQIMNMSSVEKNLTVEFIKKMEPRT
jgi:hypothetical protein